MVIPAQSSWMIRKILRARDYLTTMVDGTLWLQQEKFSIHKLYKVFVGEYNRKPWAKLICQNIAPPKYKFITWLLLYERLATCSYLSRIGIQVDQGCSLCGGKVETLDHLFFGCEFAQIVWSGIAVTCGIARNPLQWREEKEYVFTQCINNNRMQRRYRCMFSIIVYYIWKERNLRKMQGKQSTVERIIKHCREVLAWCMQKDRR